MGVASGAIVGHVIATGIAVLGGAFLAQYISEKMVNTLAFSILIGQGKNSEIFLGFSSFPELSDFLYFPKCHWSTPEREKMEIN